MPRSKNTQLIDWREKRRRHAWALHEQGWSQRRIAQELGVTQGAVSQWFKHVREGNGVEALRHHPAPGRQPQLTKAQFAQISGLVAQGAEAFGFRGDYWTLKRIVSVLNQVFGVSYHPGHISRLLQKHSPDWHHKKRK